MDRDNGERESPTDRTKQLPEELVNFITALAREQARLDHILSNGGAPGVRLRKR